MTKGYVYILTTKGNHYYIGSTKNIEKRIISHKLGRTKSLRKLLPITLIFSQEFEDTTTARKIEAKLKKFKNRGIIEKIIKEGKITTGV